jgi:ribosomal protein L11 methyltransferase
MAKSAPTYIWRKLATRGWVSANESTLDTLTAGAFAVIERVGRKRLLVEAACMSGLANRLVEAFGGRSEKLSRDWLNEMLRAKSTKPIRVGNRLVVTSAEERAEARPSAAHLVIPAGAAFGTGEHATTAMSLRLLERATRPLTKGWRMFDAGTGSGILALAGRHFGAGGVIAVENNPLALATAKENARLNRVRGIEFIEGDVTEALTGKFDLITANLYSDLLITLLPRFRRALSSRALLILSGIMRTQERELVRALKENGLELAEVRRRGKWIALLAKAPASRLS